MFSIWVYKVVRAYHVLFYMVTELVMEYNSKEEESGARQKYDKRHLVWIIVMLGYLHELFNVVLDKETQMHEKRRHKRIQQEKKIMHEWYSVHHTSSVQ